MSVVPTTRLLVTVDGIDGSGKSVLARRLVEALGERARLFAVDDFRRPVDWTRADRTELELYYEERYDLAALEGCLAAFLAGAPACSYQAFDGAAEALGERREVTFAGVHFAVVEGVFLARLPSAARAFAIYVDIPEEEARSRVMARDLAKGRTAEEVTGRIDRRYFPAHALYRAEHRPYERAALLIDNREVTAPRMMRARLGGSKAWEPLRVALASLLERSA